MASKSSTRRVDRGRGHSYLIDGAKADGVTWCIDNGVPKKALVGWAAREVAAAAFDLHERWNGLQRDEVVDMLKGAPYRDRDRAAKRGTEVHKLAEQLARGEEVTVPEELVGHVDSYLKFREEWQPADEILEFVGVNRKWRYMGTGDLMCHLNAAPELGYCGIDIKTNRSGPFGEVALQIAAYRNFESILVDGKEAPMPKWDSTLCLWIRADGYDLITFQAGDAELRAFLYAQQVAHFVEEHSKKVRGDALSPPQHEEVA